MINVNEIIRIHSEIIQELREKRIDKLDADAIATQTARMLNAARLQKDVVDLTGAECPESLLSFADIKKDK